MKIRIKGNSIRFRLTRPEVAEFCRKGYFEEQTEFDKGKFTYAVRMHENLEQLSAKFEANTIILNIPKNSAAGWDGTDKIGFENTMILENGKKLALLLEKDFTCLENREEDQSDNYPNPKLMDKSLK